MEDLKKIQEFFSKPLEENVDKKYSDFLVALRDSGAINMFGAAPYLQAEFGLDKREAREILANWMRSFGESLNENKVTKEDFDKVVKILSKSKYPFTIMLVPKWDEIDIITGQDSPDEIVDDIGQRLDSSGLNWGGNSGITISGDSSNYSRREYSDIFKVNGGHQDYFEESVNEMDINDPIMMKMRAAKDAIKNQKPDFGKEYGDAVKTAYGNDKNAKKLAFLKKERAQLMRDMEQEAEPEGGPIADEYGSKLNKIDAAIAKLSGRKEMTYDQAIAEASKGAKNYFDDLKYYYQKAFRYLESDEKKEYQRLAKNYFSSLKESINEYDVHMPSQEEVDKFFAKTNLETHYLNSKPVMGQEGTFNLMPIEPWDEYDYSNWKALVRKAKLGEGFFDRFKSKSNPKNATDKVKDPKGVKTDKKVEVQGKNVELWVDQKNQPYINYEGKFIYVQSPGLEVKYADYKQPEPSTDSEEKTDTPTTFTWSGDDLKNTSKSIGPEYELTGKSYTYKDKSYPINVNKKDKREYFQHEDGRVLDVKFVEKNTFKPFKKKVSETLAETIKLGEGVIEEELCPKGKAYIKRRKAAGEKSSAYLSGRAVKVCKGQMSGRKKRKSKKK